MSIFEIITYLRIYSHDLLPYHKQLDEDDIKDLKRALSLFREVLMKHKRKENHA